MIADVDKCGASARSYHLILLLQSLGLELSIRLVWPALFASGLPSLLDWIVVASSSAKPCETHAVPPSWTHTLGDFSPL